MELGQVQMVKSVLPIPNPPAQKYTQGEEKPYFGVTSHQGHEHTVAHKGHYMYIKMVNGTLNPAPYTKKKVEEKKKRCCCK